MAVLLVAALIVKSGKPLSALVAPVVRYHASGEINSTVESTEAALVRVKSEYSGRGELFELDGVSFEFGDWRFNVRGSNTEPLIRLNLEADTEEKMVSYRDELLALIRGNPSLDD
jgi:phosphomannomutase